MSSVILKDVLDDNEILDIINNDDVSKYHKILELNKENMINFSIKLSKSVKDKLINKFNLPNLEEFTELPLRWIKGDISPHIDFSTNSNEKFKNTYLLYLTDSIGNLIINDSIYDIKKNTAYIFNESIYHETINTYDSSRLIIGPINEYGTMVGITNTTVYGVVGTPITSYTLISTGGAITSYSLSPTSLPSGIVFSTKNGRLSGISTVSWASEDYTITASSNGVPSTTQPFTLIVSTPIAFTLSPSTVLGCVGTSIVGYTINSTGSTIAKYSLVGSLPNGISFDSSTGYISGIPTVSLPTTSYTIIAKGTNVPNVSKTFILNISLPLEFTIT
jgi:hypothetical protein